MSDHLTPATAEAPHILRRAEPATESSAPRGVLATVWNAITAVVGGVMGLLPHLLHHVGLLGGAVLVTGATGNAVCRPPAAG